MFACQHFHNSVNIVTLENGQCQFFTFMLWCTEDGAPIEGMGLSG